MAQGGVVGYEEDEFISDTIDYVKENPLGALGYGTLAAANLIPIVKRRLAAPAAKGLAGMAQERY